MRKKYVNLLSEFGKIWEKNPVILIVDDQIQNIELLEAYLVPQGYEIVPTASGEEALAILADRQIDLILLDIMMPGMDGFEVVRRIRQNEEYQQLPIMFVTVLRETEERVKGIEAGCNDFISKPVDKTELLARVSSLLKVKAYHDLMKNYRKELEVKVAERTEELAHLNADLEKKVIERTEDLNESLSIQYELNNQLINTTDILNKRNIIMEKDLDMARTIQICFIPDKSPADYIAFQYKPMEKVGGDFFDFIRFPDSDRIGIFISDVSGHGVPAAFITAMIKSSILQFSSYESNPSSILEKLNDLLVNQSADCFVTTFYGCYDPGTRELIYSSAGHNPPYIVTSDKMEYLEIKSKAPPLAIMDTRKLKDMKKGFIDETVVLEKGSKLVLYTDGLIETVNINEKHYLDEIIYENKILPGSFRAHFNKPAKLFIEGIYQDLVDFRGSNDFEDDVCIICVDVE